MSTHPRRVLRWTLLLALTLFGCEDDPPTTGPEDAVGDATDTAETDTAETDTADPDTVIADTSEDAETDAPGSPVVSVAVTSPSSPAGGQIPIEYTLTDADSDAITLEVSFVADGASSQLATRAPGGVGLTGLASSPEGTAHTFTWDSVSDLPEGAAEVVVTLVAFDDDGTSAPARTAVFAVTNAPDNEPPAIVLTEVAADQSDEVVVGYVVSDPQGDAVSLAVEFSLDGTFWAPATEAASSDGTSDLEAAPTGTAHTYIWDSGADLFGNSPSVRLRFTPSDAQAAGESAETNLFAVRNAGFGQQGLRITEINTGAVDSVELFNGTGADLSLLDYRMRWTDTENNTGTWTLPNVTLRDGERVLLVETSGTDDGTTLYFNQNIEWGDEDGGSAALIDPDDNGVDFVRWNASQDVAPQWTSWSEDSPLPVPTGFAVLARVTTTDTNTAADWCLQPPTPAAPEWGCLEDGLESGLLLSEVNLGDPLDAVELVNTGTDPINTTNWVLRRGTLDVLLAPAVIAPGARLIVVDDDSGLPETDGLLVESFDWRLADPGSLALVDPLSNGIDFVRWGGSDALPPGPDSWTAGSDPATSWLDAVSISRDASDTDTDDGSDWCLAPASFLEASAPCITPITAQSGLVINEVNMSAPDWVELLNTGSDPIVLTHAFLQFSSSLTLAIPPYVLDPGARLVVLEETGPVVAGVIYTDFNVLYSDTDPGFIELRAHDGAGLDFARWGGSSQTPTSDGGAWTEDAAITPPPDSASLSRVPDGSDSDDAGDWCAASPTRGDTNATCN